MAIDNTLVMNELKTRNSIPVLDEPKIDSYISQMKSKIMSYCNLTDIPNDLFYTIVEMVEQRMGVGMVASISRGDTNIKYKSPDEIISDFKKELNKFRRMKV